MGWKAYKPSKALRKRFKVTGTGKIKRRSGFNSHRNSCRSGNMKRRLGRPFLMHEGHAKNLRRFLGVSKIKPGKIAHERALAEKAEGSKEKSAA